MKKYYIFAAFAALISLASCNKQDGPSVTPALPAIGEKVTVDLSISTKAVSFTKAPGDAVADTEAERTIKHLDLFFFKQGDGQPLETYAEGTTASTSGLYDFRDLNVSNEKLDVYAIANAPVELKSAVKDVASLKAAVSAFTQNADANGFVMIGHVEADLPNIAVEANPTAAPGYEHARTANSKLITGLELERITNKITVAKITKDFESPALQEANVTIEGMYIINATKNVKYTEYLLGAESFPKNNSTKVDVIPSVVDAAAQAASYWNLGRSAFAANPFITQAYSSENVITAAGLTRSDVFYFYPNPAIEAEDLIKNGSDPVISEPDGLPDASDFVTKLVLLVKVEAADHSSNLYWYPIAINQEAGAARNRIYQINNITLKKAGSNANGFDKENPNGGDSEDDPNDYIVNSTLDVDITVKDWVSAAIEGSYNTQGNFVIE